MLFGPDEVPLAGLKPYLIREGDLLKLKKKSPADATVIIRADAGAPTGMVQKVIELCQETRFERFALRAEEDIE